MLTECVNIIAGSLTYVKQEKQSEKGDNWLPGEESLFRVVQDMHRTNYCAIAKLIKTKTCVQVCVDMTLTQAI